MLVSFSSWQDGSGRLLAMLGDSFRPSSHTAHKQVAKFLGSRLKQWSDETTVTVLSENWASLLETDTPGKAERSWLSLSQAALRLCGVDQRATDQNDDQKGGKTATEARLRSEVCNSRALVALGNATSRLMHWFRPLGHAPSEEEDKARRKEFLQVYKDVDVSFAALWAEVDRVCQEALAARERVGLRARKLLEARVDAVATYVQLGKDFEKKYATADLAASTTVYEGDSYTVAYFRAMEAETEEALKKWAAWTQDLSALTRDLAFFTHLVNQLTPPTSPEGRYVVVVDNLVAISCLDFLPALGFVCCGFTGSVERVPPTQDDSTVKYLDKKHLESVCAQAFSFPLKPVLLCGNCSGAAAEMAKCARCKTASYCTPACQKQAWKSHKEVCKAAPAANGKRK